MQKTHIVERYSLWYTYVACRMDTTSSWQHRVAFLGNPSSSSPPIFHHTGTMFCSNKLRDLCFEFFRTQFFLQRFAPRSKSVVTSSPQLHSATLCSSASTRET
ncbi:hypothetical protein BD779DRAFT_1508752 [Infundibulicybe gibba]|nr:hypothetical protein BD779DRAFT_1508752 [Infundibulicybe gibba]